MSIFSKSINNTMIYILGTSFTMEEDGKNITLLVCGTCKDRCGSFFPRGYVDPVCFCDKDCLQNHDCCYDYGLLCLENDLTTSSYINDGPHTTLQDTIELIKKGIENVTNRRDQECYPVIHQEGTEFYNMVTKCEGENHQIKPKCENNHSLSYESALKTPVYYKSVLYKNYHCLECNEVRINKTEVTALEPNYECGNLTIRNRAIEVYANEPYENFVRFLAENCKFYVSNVPIVAKNVHLPCDPKLIHSCERSSSTNNNDANLNNYSKYCPLYRSTVKATTANGSLLTYKNIHCAMCDGLSEVECVVPILSLGVMTGGELPSFSLLMDFEGGETDRMKFDGVNYCKSSEYFNVGTGECYENPCRRGQIEVDGTCVSLNMTIDLPIVNITGPTGIVVLVKVGLNETLNTSQSEVVVNDISQAWLKSLYWDEKIEAITPDPNCIVDPEKISNSNSTPHYACLLIHVKTRQIPLPMVSNKLSTWSRMLKRHMLAASETVQYLSIHHLNYIPSPLELPSCRTGRLMMSTDVVFSKVGDMSSRTPTHLIHNSTGLRYGYGLVPMGLILSMNQTTELTHNYFGLFCQPQIFDCEKILISRNKPGGFDWTLNGTELVIGDQQLEEDSFLVVSDTDVLVCRDVYDILTEKQESKPSTDSLVQGILTLIGNILSPLFLVFTFLTYCLFNTMRTVPGLCIMNLCVSLSSAQILFQLSPLFTGQRYVCESVAVLQHYMWLVSFLWMNVLAYITCKTFTGKGVVKGPSKSGFRLYFSYSWGLPLVFVGVCLVVDLLTTFPFNYGDSSQCWLSGKLGLICLFAVPLAVIIATNLVLFTCTLVAIKKTMDVAQKAKEKKDDQQKFVIYVKLSSVMGFTWLFGFLANLTVLTVFWYVFIVLNTLQGVFIAMSFVFTRRVMRRYQALITGKEFESSTGSHTGVTRATKSVSSVSS